MTRGRASSVTGLGHGTILRVGGRPEHEAAIMELARAHGVPVPGINEVRPDALVLERIDGPTMGQAIVRRPCELPGHIHTLADLHDRLHSIPFDGGSLIHFDLHPDNVRVARRDRS